MTRLLSFVVGAFVAIQLGSPAIAFAAVVAPAEVEAAIAANVAKVPEFVFIREEAERLGLKAYLFGGTAASFAHYVRDELGHVKGEAGFDAGRFDYDFTSIFRSTQDLDIVIDGPMAKIEQLQSLILAKYPTFAGDRGVKWELRSLRESSGQPNKTGYKEALIDSSDFLLQNYDSHSTGLIRVTQGDSTAPVRDLRDWTSKISQFEKDVLAGRLHFYLSDQHYASPRAKSGGNPEIFSVIRALTKAFQYDLSFTPETLETFKAVIARTDFGLLGRDATLKRRLLDISKKLFLHAVDLELAWNTCEQLGLRKKLMAYDDARSLDSLALLMNK